MSSQAFSFFLLTLRFQDSPLFLPEVVGHPFSQLDNIVLRDLFSLFMHYPTHGNSGCSQYLFISKNAVRVHLANIFLCTCSRVSLLLLLSRFSRVRLCGTPWGAYKGVEYTAHRMWSYSVLQNTVKLFSKVVVPVYTPTCIKGTPIAPHFP